MSLDTILTEGVRKYWEKRFLKYLDDLEKDGKLLLGTMERGKIMAEGNKNYEMSFEKWKSNGSVCQAIGVLEHALNTLCGHCEESHKKKGMTCSICPLKFEDANCTHLPHPWSKMDDLIDKLRVLRKQMFTKVIETRGWFTPEKPTRTYKVGTKLVSLECADCYVLLSFSVNRKNVGIFNLTTSLICDMPFNNVVDETAITQKEFDKITQHRYRVI